MAANTAQIAGELAHWLRSRPGVTHVAVLPAAPKRKGLLALLPLPPALRRPEPSFEIHMIYKGQARQFRYFFEQIDDEATMMSILRVHTNGELMVRVPNEFGQPMANDIYYGNRSTSAPGLGDPAPHPRSKG